MEDRAPDNDREPHDSGLSTSAAALGIISVFNALWSCFVGFISLVGGIQSAVLPFATAAFSIAAAIVTCIPVEPLQRRRRYARFGAAIYAVAASLGLLFYLTWPYAATRDFSLILSGLICAVQSVVMLAAARSGPAASGT